MSSGVCKTSACHETNVARTNYSNFHDAESRQVAAGLSSFSIGNDAAYGRGLEAYGRFQIENGRELAGKDLLREALVVFTRLGLKRAAAVEQILQSV